MKQPDILKRVDQEKVQKWLSILIIPWIVKPDYFTQMGFPEPFVRQYLKKHRNAVRINGERVKAVRGISEADFVFGLAEAIGADITKANRARTGISQVRLCVEACQAALSQIDDEKHIIADRKDSVGIQ